jgi:hypothetical protein
MRFFSPGQRERERREREQKKDARDLLIFFVLCLVKIKRGQNAACDDVMLKS